MVSLHLMHHFGITYVMGHDYFAILYECIRKDTKLNFVRQFWENDNKINSDACVIFDSVTHVIIV